ncbi:MAG: SdpI family protein [Pseudomonadota bacterium]
MTRKTANLISIAIILIAAIASLVSYPTLAEQVPTHWNAAGEIDGYSSRLTAALMGPVGALGMMLLMWVIPAISPKGFGTGEFTPVVHIFQVAMVAFMAAIGGLILLAGRGVDVSMEYLIPIGVGLLFVVLGNYMGKLRKNFFIGIRTPWTLASDEVWARTHRLGGYLFVAAGIGLMLSAFIGMNTWLITTLALGAGLIPVAYSFLLYRKIEGFDNETA